MNDVPSILTAIDSGDLHAADQLLPLVYEELRVLAARKLANYELVRRMPVTMSAIADAVRLAEIMKEIGSRWSAGRAS